LGEWVGERGRRRRRATLQHSPTTTLHRAAAPPTLEDVLFPEKFLNGNFVTSCYYANKRNK
jgi:hypothetical protein